MVLMYHDFQPSPYLTIVTKITRRSRNKVGTAPVLNRNRIFKRREFKFITKFKGDFEVKLLKGFRDFERVLKKPLRMFGARLPITYF